MRLRFAVVIMLGAIMLAAAIQCTAGAASLKISPLQYTVSLNAGETKKGFVDISNPSASSETVELSVQAFRQTDNDGSLTFYYDSMIQGGVLLDYGEVEIGPRETLHLAFSVESEKLPSGNLFAAIMASTKPKVTSAAAQSVRVGALLFITNGEGKAQQAVVDQLQLPPFQLGEEISARFALRNSGNEKENTGFFPEVRVTAWPYIDDTVSGPLVFPGIARQVDYVKRGNYFGIVRYVVKTGNSERVAYGFVVTGYWRGVAPAIVLVLVGIAFIVLRVRQRTVRRKRA